ncbi:MAG: DUF1801 domain-containing protein [Phenylobacterium sp.]
MTVQAQIDDYIGEQSPPKREELQGLHRLIVATSPGCELWFLDGRNGDGKIVSNPNIGYGRRTTSYATGETRDFYKVGLSANTSGISVYIMGLDDKTHLSQTYGKRLGKAKITGYCIRFRSVRDVDIEVLKEIVADALATPAAGQTGG